MPRQQTAEQMLADARTTLDLIVRDVEDRFTHISHYDAAWVEEKGQVYQFKILTSAGIKHEGQSFDTFCLDPFHAVEMYRRHLYDFIRDRLGHDGRGWGSMLGWRIKPVLESRPYIQVTENDTVSNILPPTSMYVVYSRLEVWTRL